MAPSRPNPSVLNATPQRALLASKTRPWGAPHGRVLGLWPINGPLLDPFGPSPHAIWTPFGPLREGVRYH